MKCIPIKPASDADAYLTGITTLIKNTQHYICSTSLQNLLRPCVLLKPGTLFKPGLAAFPG